MVIVEWLAVGANTGYVPSLQSTEKRSPLTGASESAITVTMATSRKNNADRERNFALQSAAGFLDGPN
jgi:hypothetical protein